MVHVTLSVRIFAALGVRCLMGKNYRRLFERYQHTIGLYLIVTNAVGALNPEYETGDLMILGDVHEPYISAWLMG